MFYHKSLYNKIGSDTTIQGFNTEYHLVLRDSHKTIFIGYSENEVRARMQELGLEGDDTAYIAICNKRIEQ